MSQARHNQSVLALELLEAGIPPEHLELLTQLHNVHWGEEAMPSARLRSLLSTDPLIKGVLFGLRLASEPAFLQQLLDAIAADQRYDRALTRAALAAHEARKSAPSPSSASRSALTSSLLAKLQKGPSL